MRNLSSESPILATQSLNEGDWVEGAPKWWWKYVFPTRESFWSNVLARASGPEPDPWRQQIGELLEAVVMLRTSARITDRGISQRLSKEAINKISETAGALQKISAR
jgi:hypothetical protein